jgi:hypothetical protein
MSVVHRQQRLMRLVLRNQQVVVSLVVPPLVWLKPVAALSFRQHLAKELLLKPTHQILQRDLQLLHPVALPVCRRLQLLEQWQLREPQLDRLLVQQVSQLLRVALRAWVLSHLLVVLRE